MFTQKHRAGEDVPMTTTLPEVSDPRTQALIFDCDGTLADTAPVHFLALEGAFHAIGHSISRDWYFDRLGLSRDDLFAAYRRDHAAAFDGDALARHCHALFHENLHAVREVALVAAVARENAGRRPMSVASGGQRPIVEATLGAIGLRPLFEHVVTVEDVTRGKPSPELFLLAARRIGRGAGRLPGVRGQPGRAGGRGACRHARDRRPAAAPR